nr:MAG TPA: hypothetical protein [Caudoviricetes sp.]
MSIFIYLDIYIFISFYVHTRWRVNCIDSYRYPTDRIFSICCTRKIKQCLTLWYHKEYFRYLKESIWSQKSNSV